jgi:hypothetical protein
MHVKITSCPKRRQIAAVPSESRRWTLHLSRHSGTSPALGIVTLLNPVFSAERAWHWHSGIASARNFVSFHSSVGQERTAGRRAP